MTDGIEAEPRATEDGERMNEGRHGVTTYAVTLGGGAAIAIAAELLAHPALHRWELIAALAAVVSLAVTCFLQGLILRSLRAEVRELRARP